MFIGVRTHVRTFDTLLWEEVMNITALNTSHFSGIPNSRFLENIPASISSMDDISDIVDVNLLPEMTDEEVEGLMNETIQMIGSDSVNALSVHSGIDPNRVFTLLGLS